MVNVHVFRVSGLRVLARLLHINKKSVNKKRKRNMKNGNELSKFNIILNRIRTVCVKMSEDELLKGEGGGLV
jgi:hypothetical protein